MPTFRKLLFNSLLSGVTSTFLWFAVTFWVYLETRSVVTTAVIGGAFSATSAALGIVFGTFVDRHRKKTIMVFATTASLSCYSLATLIYVIVTPDSLLDLTNVAFWLFVFTILTGSVAGNMRAIALSTCVTLLVAEPERDRANGMVGTVTGVSFAITSVFSGLVIGRLGMGWALGTALIVTLAATTHLLTITIDEPARPQPVVDPTAPRDRARFIDVRGALDAIGETPGLMALILFAAFNNLLGGVFMALMDAYGLSLVSVEAWGFLWGVLSFGFIVGGLFVARRGLGQSPLRIVIVGNLVNWSICTVFTLRSSILTLALGTHPCPRHVHLARADPRDRSGGADRPSTSGAVRTSRTRLRLRADGRELCFTAHGVLHRPHRRGGVHPLHDDRSRCRPHRRMVRHRHRTRARAHLHARRGRGASGDRAGLVLALVPHPGGGDRARRGVTRNRSHRVAAGILTVSRHLGARPTRRQ